MSKQFNQVKTDVETVEHTCLGMRTKLAIEKSDSFFEFALSQSSTSCRRFLRCFLKLSSYRSVEVKRSGYLSWTSAISFALPYHQSERPLSLVGSLQFHWLSLSLTTGFSGRKTERNETHLKTMTSGIIMNRCFANCHPKTALSCSLGHVLGIYSVYLAFYGK